MVIVRYDGSLDYSLISGSSVREIRLFPGQNGKLFRSFYRERGIEVPDGVRFGG